MAAAKQRVKPPSRAALDLAGPGLRLRALRVSDAPRILALLRDPEVPRFFLWEPPHDLAAARAYVTGFQDEMTSRWAYHFAVEAPAPTTLLGIANLYHIDAPAGEAEIGLWLGRAFWGQGVVQEVSHLLLAFGFRTLGLERLLFRVAEGNTRAQMAFRKLGATERGRVWLYSPRHDRMAEHRVYALEAAEWSGGQARE